MPRNVQEAVAADVLPRVKYENRQHATDPPSGRKNRRVSARPPYSSGGSASGDGTAEENFSLFERLLARKVGRRDVQCCLAWCACGVKRRLPACRAGAGRKVENAAAIAQRAQSFHAKAQQAARMKQACVR